MNYHKEILILVAEWKRKFGVIVTVEPGRWLGATVTFERSDSEIRRVHRFWTMRGVYNTLKDLLEKYT